MKLKILFPSLLCLGISACSSLKDTSKYFFKDGYYNYEVGNYKSKKQYVLVGSDSIKVYDPATLTSAKIDTVKSVIIAFPSKKKPLSFQNYEFRKRELDLDILTIVFKYRPGVSGFPNQLSQTFNGAFYAGFRSDVYQLSYRKNFLKIDERTITHFGYSLGAFTGLGTSRIDP